MKPSSAKMICGVAVCLFATLFSPVILAGVVLDGTRVIYPADKRDITVKVTNMGKRAVLIQSWLDNGESEAAPDKIITPFMLTPPINRVESNKAQSLRISAVSTSSLPQDRESVFWLNVLEIPAKPEKGQAVENYLQMAIRTRVKLFYRPTTLNIRAPEAAKSLIWSISGNQLSVNNPSPYYISLTDVTINGKKTEVDMVYPKSSRSFNISGVNRSNTLKAAWIDDYGARREQSFSVN
ncbi:TPA: molecular chaperone [Klebsiella michiganensis]